MVFHGVTRADFDSLNESFLAGMYAIPVEEGVFDLSVYNDLVEKTRVEVAQIRERQQRCAAVELERYASSLSYGSITDRGFLTDNAIIGRTSYCADGRLRKKKSASDRV